MESHEESAGRLRELAAVSAGAYVFIARRLALLPLPIEVPLFGADPTVTGSEAVQAMTRARTVMVDEPLPEMVRRGYDGMILEWLTVYDLVCLMRTAGLTEWRVDATEAALVRIGAIAELLDDGELDDTEAEG